MKTSTKTKLLLLLLVFSLTVPLLSACKKDGSVQTDTTPQQAEKTDTATEEVRPNFEPYNYGMDIRILQNDGSNKGIVREEWQSDEAENANLKDALVEKISYLEERYGINFKFDYKGRDNDSLANISNSILLNDGSYQIINFPLLQTSSLAVQGLLYNLTDVENIDLSQPWWNQQINDDIAYKGNNFFAVGNSNLTSMWTASAVFFNKDVAQGIGYNYSDIYNMVFDRTWTLEKMLEIAEGAYQELDGVTGYTAHDRYGITSTPGGWYTAFYGSGMKFVSNAEDGSFKLNSLDQSIINRIETITRYENDEELSFVEKNFVNDTTTDNWKQFTNGNALFLVEFVAVASDVKASDVEYGILPSPLGEAGQSQYYTTIHTGHSSCFAIPKDIYEGDLPVLGIIIEESNYISRKEVWPEMYDTLLKGMVARDPQSAKVLDVIFDHMSIDPALIYASVIDDTVRKIIYGGDTTTIFSKLDEIMGAAEGQLTKINQAYEDKIA